MTPAADYHPAVPPVYWGDSAGPSGSFPRWRYMANLNKYDPRLESLVMETRTLWDDDIGELSEDDRRFLSEALHRHPELASKIEYERSHTGFTRIITVTVEDVARLYEQQVGG